MAVPKASKNADEAKEFVKFMNSTDVAPRLAKASSFFVTARKSLFAQVGDSGIVKQLKDYSEGNHIAPRPFHQKAAQAESVIDDIAQSYLTNQMSLDAAMKQGLERIKSLG
jgi:ABC-type glycerol-3-phosphate transport system substrate-binding protein